MVKLFESISAGLEGEGMYTHLPSINVLYLGNNCEISVEFIKVGKLSKLELKFPLFQTTLYYSVLYHGEA